jgi:serine/threonine protein kinase
MLCRSNVSGSDADSEHKASQVTVFDNLFDSLYRMRTLRAQVQRTSMQVFVPARRLIKATGLVGTMQYMSPEMIAREPYFEIVDWWSCGVLFFECITRKRLFAGSGNGEIAKSILTCDIPAIIEENKESLGSHLSDLLMHMLDRNVTRRYDSRLIKRHSYFNTVEPYMVGKRFTPASVDRTNASRGCDSTLPSLNMTSFRDLCKKSSEYRPQPIPPDKLTAELKESLKQDFYSSGATKTSITSSSSKVRSGSVSKKDNSKSCYSFMPKLEEDSDEVEESDDDVEAEGKILAPSFE